MASNGQANYREKKSNTTQNDSPRNPKREGRASAKSSEKDAPAARGSDPVLTGSGTQHGKHHARNEDWDELPSNNGR